MIRGRTPYFRALSDDTSRITSQTSIAELLEADEIKKIKRTQSRRMNSMRIWMTSTRKKNKTTSYKMKTKSRLRRKRIAADVSA